MIIRNATRKTTLATDVTVARTFLSRLRGLIGRQTLNPDEALMIPSCRAIHMFFMGFSIDAVFIGQDNRVLGLLKDLRPFRISPVFLKASYVVEMPAGVIEESHTALGDVIELKE